MGNYGGLLKGVECLNREKEYIVAMGLIVTASPQFSTFCHHVDSGFCTKAYLWHFKRQREKGTAFIAIVSTLANASLSKRIYFIKGLHLLR